MGNVLTCVLTSWDKLFCQISGGTGDHEPEEHRQQEERGPPQDVAPIHGDVRRRTWSRGHLLHLRLGWRSVDEVLPNLQQEVRQAGLQRSQWELKKPFDNN